MGFYLVDNPNPSAQATVPYSGWGYWGIPDSLPQPPRVITVHTAENNPDLEGKDGGAEAVARFFATTSRRVSVHKVVDSDSIVDLLPDTHRAIHSRSAWRDSLSFEISYKAAWWGRNPAYEMRLLKNAAAICRNWVAQHGISVRRIDLAAYESGASGLIAHADLDPTRRSDPGPRFPWPTFLTMIRDEEEDMLTRGDANSDVVVLQNLLTQYHDLLPEPDQEKVSLPGPSDGQFGPRTQAAVLAFQRYIGLEPNGVANSMTVGVLTAQVASNLERPVDTTARSTADRAEEEARSAHQRLNNLRDI